MFLDVALALCVYLVAANLAHAFSRLGAPERPFDRALRVSVRVALGFIAVLTAELNARYDITPMIVLNLAVIGDLFPIGDFSRGGKGRAIAIAGLFASYPTFAFCLVSIFGILQAFIPKFQIPFIGSCIALPLLASALGAPVIDTVLLSLVSCLLLWADRGRLLRAQPSAPS